MGFGQSEHQNKQIRHALLGACLLCMVVFAIMLCACADTSTDGASVDGVSADSTSEADTSTNNISTGNNSASNVSLSGNKTSSTENASSEDEREPLIQKPTTQPVKLVSLMGLTYDEALDSIGHGAREKETALSSAPSSGAIESDAVDSKDNMRTIKDRWHEGKQTALVLTHEKGDLRSGTPTVLLGFNKSGLVQAASYEASLASLGYGKVPFADAVSTYHLVEQVLSKVGLEGIEPSNVELPAQDKYSTYDSDGTLICEAYTFSGKAAQKTTQKASQKTTQNTKPYLWSATLVFDYQEANKQANLAYTVKKIAVSVVQAS